MNDRFREKIYLSAIKNAREQRHQHRPLLSAEGLLAAVSFLPKEIEMEIVKIADRGYGLRRKTCGVWSYLSTSEAVWHEKKDSILTYCVWSTAERLFKIKQGLEEKDRPLVVTVVEPSAPPVPVVHVQKLSFWQKVLEKFDNSEKK